VKKMTAGAEMPPAVFLSHGNFGPDARIRPASTRDDVAFHLGTLEALRRTAFEGVIHLLGDLVVTRVQSSS
jgi:hypothetical protein